MVSTFKKQVVKWPFVPSSQIASQIGVSADSLKNYRKSGALPKGIYWFQLPGATRISWNLELVRDWAVNGNSQAHQAAVKEFLASLPSSRISAAK
jgi:hypothetical protein